LRESYIEGWYQLDAEQLLATTSEEFIFDDSFEAQPVTREQLPDYMLRWDQRSRELGGNNQRRITHHIRQDKGGIPTDWEWWELLDTSRQGAAIVLTGNEGVLLERITYFDR